MTIDFGPGGAIVLPTNRKLPIKIKTIKLILKQVINCVVNEEGSFGGVRHHPGVFRGVVAPAADRKNDLQIGIDLFEGDQLCVLLDQWRPLRLDRGRVLLVQLHERVVHVSAEVRVDVGGVVVAHPVAYDSQGGGQWRNLKGAQKSQC